MKYQPPFGSADPNASYVDRNTPGAIRGSVPPAKGLEQPQRELIALLVACGLVPSDTDLLQVARAVRSHRMNWVPTPGGTANALTITLDPPVTSLTELVGVPLFIRFAAANTSATVTISVNGLAATSLYRAGDSSLQVGDLQAGATCIIMYDGSVFRTLTLPRFGFTFFTGGFRTPTGHVVQYGNGGSSAGGPVTVTLPVSYSSASYKVFVTDESSPASPVGMSVFGTGTYAVSGFQVFGTRDFTNFTADSFNWLTIGV